MNNLMKSAPAESSKFLYQNTDIPKETVVTKEVPFKNTSELRKFLEEKNINNGGGLQYVKNNEKFIMLDKVCKDLYNKNFKNPSENFKKFEKEQSAVMARFFLSMFDKEGIYTAYKNLSDLRGDLKVDLKTKTTASDSLELANNSFYKKGLTVEKKVQLENFMKTMFDELLMKIEALLVKYNFNVVIDLNK